jgi:transcriptional regulator with XRE-family HTH domain
MEGRDLRTEHELLNISVNIQSFRKKLGWSRRELARQLNTSPPVIIRWEEGYGINSTSLKKLADLFGITITDLFNTPRANYTHTQVTVIDKDEWLIEGGGD